MIDQSTLWTVIICLGVGSFGLRFIFTGLVGDRQLPTWIMRHLRYTAVAVLPGLVAPLVLWPAATSGETDPARLTAACVTLACAYITKRLLLSIGVGAATLYGLLFLLGS